MDYFCIGNIQAKCRTLGLGVELAYPNNRDTNANYFPSNRFCCILYNQQSRYSIANP